MTDRRRAAPSAQNHLVDHEFAVVFADRARCGRKAGVGEVGRLGPFPDPAEQLLEFAVVGIGLHTYDSMRRQIEEQFQALREQEAEYGPDDPYTASTLANTADAAMRVGEVSFIAPFRYTRLVFAMVIGLFVFGERPDALMLAGSALIITSGLYTFFREQRLRRRTRPVRI